MKKTLFFLLTLFFFCQSLSAAITVVSNRMKGVYHAQNNPNGLVATKRIFLQDDQYSFMINNPSTWPQSFTNCSVSNRVVLHYEEGARVYYAAPWSMSVSCTLFKWGTNGAAVTPNETFTVTINYDPAAGTVYTDKDMYVSTNPGYKTELLVNSVTLTGISAVPADVVLESEIEVKRSWAFNQLVANTGIGHSYFAADNALSFYWNYQTGAESYDLEFVHVSSYDPISVANPDFTRATRINTSLQSYTINLPYDDGFIAYRVRAVGSSCDQPDFRREAVWGSGSSLIAVSNLDVNRNWQYNVSYAEDGKRKEVVMFYDGTGKQRQAVTVNNSENKALIGETFYDYEGRPAVQTLPAPEATRDGQLQYYQSFSLVSSSTNVYSKKVFDKDAMFNTSSCNWNAPAGMATSQGASNYYSSLNMDVSNGMYAALPDAKEFPFVETMYGVDGRPVKQSAPGIDHTVGTDHAVETFYSSPTQVKLDRLFGNEVGYSQHYNQVTVKDPNGQLSVSYIDLSGRTIATALVGNTPTNLDALSSNTSQTLIESFDNSNIYDPQTQSWMVNLFYTATTSGNYTFTYTMSPEQYATVCTGQTFNCVYDLKINIYDACGNLMTDDQTPDVIGTAYTITYPGAFSKTFTVTIPKAGLYRIEKILTLNQAAMQTALAAYQAALPGTCFQTQSSLLNDLNTAVDLSECVGCDSSCVNKAIALGLTGTVKQQFIDSCKTHDCAAQALDVSTCGALLNTLAGDLSPGGQYFDNVPSGSGGNPNDSWLTTYVWANGSGSWTPANFRDANGNLITSWAGMRANWQNGWATQTFTTTISGKNTLAEFHPEYCQYTWCNTFSAGKAIDFDMQGNNSFAWAQANPVALPYINTSQSPVGLNVLNQDPYYNTTPGNGDYSAMQTQLNNYNSTGQSMWAYAGTLAGCTNCDQQWIIFRSLYVSVKQQQQRARQIAGGCGYLCDATLPPDFFADCSGASTNGFMIRVPDLVGTLSSLPASGWGTNAQTIIPCNTSLNTVQITVGMASSPGSVNSVAVNYSSTDITGGLVPAGSYTPASLAYAMVVAINTFTSSPDFTAVIDPNNAARFIVSAPANISASSWTLTTTYSSPVVLTFTITPVNTTIACPTQAHCFCNQLYQLEQFWNATSASSPYAGGFIVNHAAYASLDAYIVSTLNTAYGTTVSTSDVATWRANCSSTNRGNPIVNAGSDPALPAALNCEAPTYPCVEDANQITNYYAGFFYQQLVEQASNDFIQQYIAHCFSGAFTEHFEVTHEDREYHYTLYYYDQAGNLTRTVPPAGVKMLSGATLTQVNTYRLLNTGSPQYPAHARSSNTMVTNYKYNSFNALTESATPDGGISKFYYDKIGRIVASQNAKQAVLGGNNYSYTLYDAQGRIFEVGQVNSGTTISATVTATMAAFTSWVSAGARTQVTSTYYDAPLSITINNLFAGGQTYLRKRIGTVTIEQTYDGNASTYDHATHYSYDVHGNVNQLVQDYPALSDLQQQYKKMAYTYDLISGNVNEVKYQEGAGDQYYHHYFYDADNRVTNVYTAVVKNTEAGWSSGVTLWEQDAKYQYYLHGPLGRTELGDKQVQGQDYVYTIQGWIKGVNSNVLDRTKDIGKDGQATNSFAYNSRGGVHSNMAQDAYGYVLGYFWENAGADNKDYKPINSNSTSLYNDVTSWNATGANLYNGNIKEMSTALSKPNGTGLPLAMELIVNHYKYDQLNRIKSSNSYTGTSTTSYAALALSTNYQNTFTYDANGNIQTQLRNGSASAGGTSMDNLTYYYWNASHTGTYTMNGDGTVPTNATNQLAYVDDAGTAGNYTDDLEDQSAGNYTYDEIGQLKSDVAEGISNIDWTVYGKIKTVSRTVGNTKKELNFEYDAMGQRVLKLAKDRDALGIKKQDSWTYTYYVRDAQGNVMATYKRTYTELSASQVKTTMALQETNVYGAARLAVKDRTADNVQTEVTYNYNAINIDKSYHTTGIASTVAMVAPNTATPKRKLGYKNFELSNHLGNVLVTVSDRKLEKNTGGNLDWYVADVRTTSDYSAFGAPLVGRSYTSTSYRYGFNGKETDSETGTQDYGMRIYNPALGKFLSVDPITANYPELTPYQFASNSPIIGVDLDGLELQITIAEQANLDGQAMIKIVDAIYIQINGDEIVAAYNKLYPNAGINQAYVKGVISSAISVHVTATAQVPVQCPGKENCGVCTLECTKTVPTAATVTLKAPLAYTIQSNEAMFTTENFATGVAEDVALQAAKSRFPVAGVAIEKYQQFVEITEIIAGDAEAMAGVAAGAAESSTLARALGATAEGISLTFGALLISTPMGTADVPQFDPSIIPNMVTPQDKAKAEVLNRVNILFGIPAKKSAMQEATKVQPAAQDNTRTPPAK
jgi:RHS repeat-associated protein